MVFFSPCHALITWFGLSRVELNRNDLKGIKQKLLRVSSRFELTRGRVTEDKIIVM